MIRFTIFIIALLLAIGALEATGPWLVTLAVLAGIELLSWRRPRLRWPARHFSSWTRRPWTE